MFWRLPAVPRSLAGNEVSITRGSGDAKPALDSLLKSHGSTDPLQNVIVDPGDTVQVKRAGIVYVLGAVNRPGGYIMQEDGTLNVLQAISLANGTSIAASTGTIYLLRRNADGTEIDIALPLQEDQPWKTRRRGTSRDRCAICADQRREISLYQ